jgi:isoleucyl-tRNA synthetase
MRLTVATTTRWTTTTSASATSARRQFGFVATRRGPSFGVSSRVNTDATTRRALVVRAGKGGKADGGGGKKKDNAYGATVRLPKTTFEMRANSVQKEPVMQKWWKDNRVYETLAERENAEAFTLHDGPPYANGDLHIGHALNKILKDFVNRWEMMNGKKVRYVPGWDCHGLPIELKVLQSMDAEARKELTPIKLRYKAKKFAMKTVDNQREQFKRYGIWGDWEEPYMTLLPEYEAAQLEVFGKMFLNGHIYRGKKPVHWSPSSMTALAEAELEYPEGHVSQSIYVAFKVSDVPDSAPAQLKELLTADGGASLAVWTTTPWTMPANAAVAVNAKLDYSVVRNESTGETLVVADGLRETVQAKLETTLTTLATFKGSDLENVQYQHPMYERKSPVIIGGEYITTDAGTGLVHTAPGHGQDDYISGMKYGLPLYSPVDNAGLFTAEAGSDLEGKDVLGDGNVLCIEKLTAAGALLKQEAYNHKYPYDWRTKKPTIFRATEQWFASVEGFRDNALSELDKLNFIPESGSKRMRPMVSGRSDWCISRQRAWGVPIPAFYHKDTNEVLMDEAIITHFTEIVRKRGTDAWWEMDIEELLPEEHKAKAGDLVRGSDTMDVWFDSGTSWAGVVKSRGLSYPADLYLEGSDQHRGWFQSSLLTGVASSGMAPYKTILTHGFVLDEKGYKMSKSLGNVIDPRQVIEGGKNQKAEPGYGADTLRLWVASTDYSGDVNIGMNIIKQTSEAYRKLRGTIRFLMGVLDDFKPEEKVEYDNLPSFEKYILHRLDATMNEIEASYKTYDYARVVASISSFTTFLSNVYLDVSKDKLYIGEQNDIKRRACQTVVSATVERLIAAIAPLTPHMAEEAFQALPYDKPNGAISVFIAGWPTRPEAWSSLASDDVKFWDSFLEIRDTVNKVLEDARNAKLVGASLESKVNVHCEDADFTARLNSPEIANDLRYLFIVSDVQVTSSAAQAVDGCEFKSITDVPGAGSVSVGIARAAGHKCARCWNFSTLVGADAKHSQLCERCVPIVNATHPDLVVPEPEPVA